MRLKHRRVHLVAWTVLGPVVVGLVVLAWVSRPAAPLHEGEAPGSTAASESGGRP